MLELVERGSEMVLDGREGLEDWEEVYYMPEELEPVIIDNFSK